jgi:hypothetical protein
LILLSRTVKCAAFSFVLCKLTPTKIENNNENNNFGGENKFFGHNISSTTKIFIQEWSRNQ